MPRLCGDSVSLRAMTSDFCSGLVYSDSGGGSAASVWRRPEERGAAWLGVAWRGVAWRGDED